ncbi:hypothetical protein LX66_2299 [Chitinophaga japonensis]|uniref:Subunit length determinant protein n=2 Tax=Chitinophaga japonensis TaxID=104662 RepID=A0A562T576_CHIJA|nr:hypothetical protein LX66_2299 [Chitinophaga japonensis]
MIVQQKEEMSLRELVLKIQRCCRYVLGKWMIIGICGVAGAAAGTMLALLDEKKFAGELTFVLEESRSSPLSAYAGVASQLGVDLNTGSSNGVFEGDNIMKFLSSRLMVERTLLFPVITGKDKKTLADLYMEFSGLQEKWSRHKRLQGINFPAGYKRAKFSLLQDSILNVLQERIVENNLEVSKPDKKLNFISVKCISRNELFSKVFTEQLVKEATDFYIETKTMRNKANTERLQGQADSLKTVLSKKVYTAASVQDLYFNPAKQVAGIRAEEELRDKLILQTMYAEVVKNLEISKMAMAQETPVIQIVDTPILPLKIKKLGILKGIFLGGILGGLLAGAFFLVKYTYRRILRDEV